MDIFHIFQMVGATRGTPEGFRPDQTVESSVMDFRLDTLHQADALLILSLFPCHKRLSSPRF
jgi:hypothetical protein